MKGLITVAVLFGIVALFNAQSFTPETNTVSGVIRDFWPCKNLDNCGKYGVNIDCDPSACLPDVEMSSGSYTPGLILNYLDSSRKPIFNNATTNSLNISNATTFYYWFHNSEKFSKQFVANLTLSNTECVGTCNGYTYGYRNNSYFPLNNMGFGNYGPGFPNQNFHFCLELHLRFTYKGTEFYSFTGDDDLWVFINNKLVIDLGGIHSAMSRSIQLNTTDVLKDMVIGQTYPFDMFYCERHTTQSNLALYTDLALDCPYYDWCGVCQGNGQECCECNDNSVCTDDLCDVYTGACIFKKTSPPGDTTNMCYPWSCDAVSGWSQSTLNCDDGDACTVDTCVNATGCSHQAKVCNDGNSCTEDSCNSTTGCVYKQLPNDPCSNAACVPGQNPAATHICNTTDYCKPQVCVNNDCVTAYVLTCDDKNACTNDLCSNGTCINTPKNCTDNSVCTTDSCNNGTCVNEKISCDDGNLCTNDMCDDVSGCYYTNVTFEAVANCMTSYCDPVVGVVTTPIVCLPKSTCSCQNNACVCKSNFLQSTGAKIGAGVIAAIVVGIVVAVVIFAVVGKKGYDYYQTAHAATTPLGTNPLYEDKGDKGNNPFYSDETA